MFITFSHYFYREFPCCCLYQEILISEIYCPLMDHDGQWNKHRTTHLQHDMICWRIRYKRDVFSPGIPRSLGRWRILPRWVFPPLPAQPRFLLPRLSSSLASLRLDLTSRKWPQLVTSKVTSAMSTDEIRDSVRIWKYLLHFKQSCSLFWIRASPTSQQSS